jgi:hypothetical protein
MAAKKVAAKKVVAVGGCGPVVERWYAKADRHPVVEREKTRVRGKARGTLWPLHSQRTLGVMLLALGRTSEGLRVLDEAASAVRRSSRCDPWFVAACCAALAHWTREREGLAAKPALLMKFADPGAHAAQGLQAELWTKAQFAKALAASWRTFAEAERDDHELGIDTMSFHLAEVVFLREVHVLAPVHVRKVAAATVDRAVERGLRAVATKMEARARA